MVKVSVIVPVYNVEQYLGKCLDSLINQTLKDIEIIVVNDGSPDDSQKIIDKYAKKYNNIKAYKKENGGLSDARNYGIKRANAKYIAFVDSDDYVSDNMLEIMYNKAIDEDLDIVVCDTINVYSDREQYLISNYNYSDDDIKNYLVSPPMACVRIYNSNLFDNMEFKNKIYYEDLELIPKFVNKTSKIGFVNEGLYYYLQRDGSIMKQQVWNDKLLDIFKVLDSNYEELYDKYPEEIEYMYITHLLRTASLRFLEYNGGSRYISKIREVMKNKFPNWKKNIYYKKSSIKLKVLCVLAYYKQIFMLKMIKKITNK